MCMATWLGGLFSPHGIEAAQLADDWSGGSIMVALMSGTLVDRAGTWSGATSMAVLGNLDFLHSSWLTQS
jgi:hypothetical protein